jgi:hypothetical protein
MTEGRSTATSPHPGGLRETLLFALAIFASAFLIFLVQPMVGKRIVPWFGGTPAVWTLCLAFYQTVLFLGYAYAHGLVRWVPPRRQGVTHAVVLAAALAALPVLPDETWKPTNAADPNTRILSMLAANVALPFLLLAATGPLLQTWFARAFPQRSPYPLYALSNLGSMLALLAYPFAIEPVMALSDTSAVWSWAFGVTGIGILVCAWLGSRHPVESPNESGLETDSQRTGAAGRTLWFLLPCCAVVLFMGASNELCLDVASVPFLWVAPLSVYLLTFIVCFASERFYRRVPTLLCAGAIAATLVALNDDSPTLIPRMGISVYGQIGAYGGLILVCCTLLHGELYRLRPPPERLTEFYMSVSAGGAVGGLFVGLLAPHVFQDYDELGVSLVAGGVLLVAAWLRDPTSALQSARFGWAYTAAAATVVGAMGWVLFHKPLPGAVTLQQRNFYGVLRVVNIRAGTPPRFQVALRNGTTGHGFQLQHRQLRAHPTNYYSYISGVGLALSGGDSGSRKVGLIGLGIGTLAAYGKSGDVYKFYEIDADVVRIARDTRFFHYLSDSAAQIEVVVGDGRLTLETELRENGPEQFDVLVLDAFTSDAIPIHLLTREALELYRQHLRDDGLLAVHVSSLHLNLAPVVHRLAEEAGLHAISVRNRQVDRIYAYAATWVLVSGRPETLEQIEAFARTTRKRHRLGEQDLKLFEPPASIRAGASVWTDDYSNLFGVVRRKPGH